MSIWHTKVKKAFIRVANKEMDQDDFIKEYRSLVDELVCCRKRLKNPIHKRTGLPLAASTILGFHSRIDSIKNELRHYRVVVKLLRLFGHFGGTQAELTTEEQVIKSLLRNYALQEEMSDRAYQEHMEMKKQVGEWHDLVIRYNNEVNQWRDLYYEIKELHDQDDEENRKPQQRARVYPFPVINGGQKIEDHPPFTN